MDWGVLYLTEKIIGNYLLAATISFFCALFCNYFMSKLMVFNGCTAALNPIQEFFAHAAIGTTGLLFTLGLMYVFTEWMSFYFMISKAIATILVLVWNYSARRMLYR